MITILIVDDHDLVRMGLSRILDDVEDFAVVGEAESGEEALASVRQFKPDVVMMDVKMPGIGGVEATKRILSSSPKTKVIVVTSCEDDLYPSKLMRAGASAYVTKKATPEELIEAINKVASGKNYISAEIAQQLAVKNATPFSEEGSPFEQLSDRELQVAMMTIEGRKPNDIAATLSVSAKTVNSFRYRIFEKFKISSDVELVHLAIRHKLFDVDAIE